MKLLTATTKGLIIYEIREGDAPILQRVHFAGFAVNLAYVDERTGRWWIAIAHKHWGQKLHYSDDQGDSWGAVNIPSFEGASLPDGRPASVRQIWCIHHGGTSYPGHLWLGTDPGGLFHSTNNGQTFSLVDSLWNHPSRQKKEQWFGAGSDQPFIHSIIVDPTNNDHVYIAVSSAGVFETRDRGASWTPKNEGLLATFLPNPHVQVGHDPHHMLMSPADHRVLWQQNHSGVFYTRNGGESWIDVSDREGLPHYGFALAVDEKDPGKAWVIPVTNDDARIPPDLRLQVLQTSDFGVTWKPESVGLPVGPSFDIVLRQAFVRFGGFMAFGTNSGNLFCKRSIDVNWNLFAAHLSKVNCLCMDESL